MDVAFGQMAKDLGVGVILVGRFELILSLEACLIILTA